MNLFQIAHKSLFPSQMQINSQLYNIYLLSALQINLHKTILFVFWSNVVPQIIVYFVCCQVITLIAMFNDLVKLSLM
jgi:hypothetical protein